MNSGSGDSVLESPRGITTPYFLSLVRWVEVPPFPTIDFIEIDGQIDAGNGHAIFLEAVVVPSFICSRVILTPAQYQEKEECERRGHVENRWFIFRLVSIVFSEMNLLMDRPFQAFATPHNLAMLVTLFTAVVLIAYARSGPSETKLKRLRYTMGILLLLAVALDPVLILKRYGLGEHGWEVVMDNSLPFYLCDVVSIFLAFALFTKNQRLVEIGYLWGVAGTMQGLLMPTLWFDHKEIEFYIFFLQHGGAPVAAVFLVWGLKIFPEKGALLRAVFWSLGYIAIVMSINWLIDQNYGFLNGKPDADTLFDYMGPWPRYLITLQLIAYTLYAILLKIAPKNQESHSA